MNAESSLCGPNVGYLRCPQLPNLNSPKREKGLSKYLKTVMPLISKARYAAWTSGFPLSRE